MLPLKGKNIQFIIVSKLWFLEVNNLIIFYFQFRPNYEAHNIRLNSVTGWCGRKEAFTYVSVDLGHVYRIKVSSVLDGENLERRFSKINSSLF